MAGQRRHWVHTVHKGHLGDDEMTDDTFAALVRVLFEGLEEDTRCRWFSGQFEICPDTDRYHAQCYSEWHSSLRMSEVYKAIPSHLEMKSKDSTRTQARDYSLKEDSRVAELGSIGEWLPDAEESARLSGGKSSKTLSSVAVAAIVEEGMTPEEIALEYPKVYFQHYPRIIALCDALGVE